MSTILGFLLFCAGIAIAPTFAARYSLASSELKRLPSAGPRRSGWLSTAFQVGGALGALSGEVVVQAAEVFLGAGRRGRA